MMFEHAYETFLPIAQPAGRPVALRSHLLRQDEGRCFTFPLEVHVFLGGKFVVTGGGVLRTYNGTRLATRWVHASRSSSSGNHFIQSKSARGVCGSTCSND